MTGATGVVKSLKENVVENPKMQFMLKGFSQVMGFRIFAFDGIAVDRTRMAFTVRTDTALTQRYGIRLQELPLLCRELLERRGGAVEKRALTYTEEDMCIYTNECAEARARAALKRRAPRRSVPVQAETV